MVNDDGLVDWMVSQDYSYDPDKEKWVSPDGKDILKREEELQGLGVRKFDKKLIGLKKGLSAAESHPGSHVWEIKEAAEKIKTRSKMISSVSALKKTSADRMFRESGFDPLMKTKKTKSAEQVVQNIADKMYSGVSEPVLSVEKFLSERKGSPSERLAEIQKVKDDIARRSTQASKILRTSKIFSEAEKTEQKRGMGIELSPLEIVTSLGRRGSTVKNFARRWKLDPDEARKVLKDKGLVIEPPKGKTGVERFRLR